MTTSKSGNSQADACHQVDQLARRERGRLIATLVAQLGYHNLELAEDVAQEALLQALSLWSYQGIPDSPTAWLRTVARNKAFDRLRRIRRDEPFELERNQSRFVEPKSDGWVEDVDLRLIFLTCHPALNIQERLALTLRMVCGFTARELADLFLSSEAAIAKRLSRGKAKLRRIDTASLASPTRFELTSRTEMVLRVIYLMFCAGYFPRSGHHLIKGDVVAEAIRLLEQLIAQHHTDSKDARAVLALFYLHASRFSARSQLEDQITLFADQDRSLWDRELIDKGMLMLATSRSNKPPGRYHLEAGIAACYAVSESWNSIDWAQILTCYDALESIDGSPVISLNRCIALAHSGDARGALKGLKKLQSTADFAQYSPYFFARAKVHEMLNHKDLATSDYAMAAKLSNSHPVQALLEQLSTA